MFEGSSYYALDDSKRLSGLVEISEDQIAELNSPRSAGEEDRTDRQLGIFFSVNSFRGQRRLENLEKINAWYVDIDGNKEAIRPSIYSGPVSPSMINETKNGFHLFWLAKDATVDNWTEIQTRLINYYKADRKAKDVARILRMPNCYHWKDQNNPFLVKTLKYVGVEYKEADMLRLLPTVPDPLKFKRPAKAAKVASNPLEKLFTYDCVKGLKKLSGSEYVKGEKFSFEENSNGTWQILCNGARCAAWIDGKGKIGSLSGAGPSLYQWLAYYGHNANSIKLIAEQELGL